MSREIQNSEVIRSKGEALAQHRLSEYCLIRHVPSAGDVGGPNLYCSLLDRTQPYCHFWVQVKISVSKKFCKPTDADVAYWRRQPLPAFILQLAVAEYYPESTVFKMRMINLTDAFIEAGPKGKPSNLSTKNLSTEHDFEYFFNDTVPSTVARHKVLTGTLPPIEFIKDRYFKTYIDKGLEQFLEDMFTQIGQSVRFLIADILAMKNPASGALQRRQAEKILAAFQDNREDWHYHYYYGLSKLEDGGLDEAEAAFMRAVRVVKSTIRNRTTSRLMRNMIEAGIESCKKRKEALNGL